MKYKKIFASILVLLFILQVFAACGDGAKKVEETSGGGISGNDETEAVETGPKRPDLPKETFGGYEFRFLSRGLTYSDNHWQIKDTVPYDENTGDVINDAVLLRNQYIEETYNVKIVMVEETSYETKAKNAIMANEDNFDVFNDSIGVAAKLAKEGYLVDLYDVPYLGFDQPWWDQNACAQLSIKNKLFFTVNEMTLMDKDATWVVLFTKDMIKDYQLDDPYKMVADNKWLLDKMSEMSYAVAHDVDGDGVMKDDDCWGLVGEAWNVNPLLIGSGTRTFTKNKDDIPEFTMDTERTFNAFEKIYSFFGNKEISLISANIKGTYKDLFVDLYGSLMERKQALFYITGMNRVFLLRGLEADFGILPNPKYDERQENHYHNMSYFNANCIAVPVTNTDLRRTGILLEAIAYESSITSFVAYLETSVKTKYSRDEESVAMLDIIYSSRVYDLGRIYEWGSASTTFLSLVQSKTPDAVSQVAKIKEATIAAMEKTLETFGEKG